MKRKDQYEFSAKMAFYGIMLGIILMLGFLTFGCTSCVPEEMVIIDDDFPPSYYESGKTVSVGTINLSALDSVGCIYYWEVQNDTLRIITVEDEIENELLRLKEIQDLYYE